MAKIIHAFNSTNGQTNRQDTAYEATHPLGEVLVDIGVSDFPVMLHVFANREDIPATGGDGHIFELEIHEDSREIHLPHNRFVVLDKDTHASIDTTPYYPQ